MSAPNKDHKGPQSPKSYAQAASEGTPAENPPPPYTAGGSGSGSQQQQRSYQYQTGPRRLDVRAPLLGAQSAGVVVVVPHRQIALGRARRRFFGALFWALMIWLVAGVLFGDYELEQSRRHRHRSPRHPDWIKFDEQLASSQAESAANVPVEAPAVDVIPEFV